MVTIINDTINNPYKLIIESNYLNELIKECEFRFDINKRISDSLTTLGFAFVNAFEGNGQAYILKVTKV